MREVKKSNRKEGVHVAQLKYYLFVLERNQVPVQYGILEYPKLRITEEVWLSAMDRIEIPAWEAAVQQIITNETCPDTIDDKICKKCAYFEFCYAG